MYIYYIYIFIYKTLRTTVNFLSFPFASKPMYLLFYLFVLFCVCSYPLAFLVRNPSVTICILSGNARSTCRGKPSFGGA